MRLRSDARRRRARRPLARRDAIWLCVVMDAVVAAGAIGAWQQVGPGSTWGVVALAVVVLFAGLQGVALVPYPEESWGAGRLRLLRSVFGYEAATGSALIAIMLSTSEGALIGTSADRLFLLWFGVLLVMAATAVVLLSDHIERAEAIARREQDAEDETRAARDRALLAAAIADAVTEKQGRGMVSRSGRVVAAWSALRGRS